MVQVRAEMHGAISIVNAIATGRGATLGISIPIQAVVEAVPGRGIVLKTRNPTFLHA